MNAVDRGEHCKCDLAHKVPDEPYVEFSSTATSLTRIKLLANLRVSPRSKFAFITTCKRGARVFDIGCGNGSPSYTKAARPDIYYVGLDIMDLGHALDPRSVADEYIITTPDMFSEHILTRHDEFDDVISSHNLEHCNEPHKALVGMARAIRSGGRLMLSFPSEASLRFPSRAGCLNFRDDPTHSTVPDYPRVVDTLRSEGMNITFAAQRYRPIVKALVGAALEPVSRLRRKVLWGTWAFWGFETVIWAEKN